MPNPLTLEVTILITVDRDWYDEKTDEAICDQIQTTEVQIYNSDWDSVTVRAAEPDCHCFAHQSARMHYIQALNEYPCAMEREEEQAIDTR